MEPTLPMKKSMEQRCQKHIENRLEARIDSSTTNDKVFVLIVSKKDVPSVSKLTFCEKDKP